MSKKAGVALNILFASLLGGVPLLIIWSMLWSDTSGVVISAVGGVLALGAAAVAYSHVDPNPI